MAAHAIAKTGERAPLDDVAEVEGCPVTRPRTPVDLREKARQENNQIPPQERERERERAATGQLKKLREAARQQVNKLEPLSSDALGPVINHLKQNAGRRVDWLSAG